MITLKKIREAIEKSENPLIFFDDDPDGLCSYLMIRRYFNKGKGYLLKSSPKLDVSYAEKVRGYSPDLVLVLDKPIIEQEFVDNVSVPIIWIDHHPIVKIKGVRYYNPRLKNKKDNRATSYWCWSLTRKDLWLAAVGVVADWQQALLLKEFSKRYPNYLRKDVKEHGKIMYETKLGELVRIFSFILKGKSSEVGKAINCLMKIDSPEEILEKKSELGKFIFDRAYKIKRQYDELLKEALISNKKGKIVRFLYSNEKWSFTSDLANELMHNYPGKVIIVGREKNNEIRMSLRSPENGIILPNVVNRALNGLEGYGGGHDHASGANIKKEDFEEFVRRIEKEIK